MFSRLGAAAIKADLTNTLALCEALGNPHSNFRSIHIAGTNGKGSTSHMLAAIFQEAGFKTGLYTSPHLVDFRERIRVNGKMIHQEFVVDFVHRNQLLIERIAPSFFEITVAMAFTAFSEAGVDIAIVETGLGGRLDSTNVIMPELSIITNISFDHKDLLGDSIPKIAAEKAGIIKPGVPVITGKMIPEALQVMDSTAESNNAFFANAPQHWNLSLAPPGTVVPGLCQYDAVPLKTNHSYRLVTDMAGSFQAENIATVLTAVEHLPLPYSKKIDRELAFRALGKVKKTTGLRGRWDVWQEAPLIIADVAHNPAGLSTVMEDWSQLTATKKHIILGFVRDKDVREALALIPKDAALHFCAANIPRALPVDELAAIAAESGLTGKTYPSVAHALKEAKALLRDTDALLITGSFFIVGEAMEAMEIPLPE